jgi:hypothetical protein
LFTLLDDWDLRDFNFSRFWDPDLKPGHGPDESALYRLVFESRKGVSHAAQEFGNTMYWTLRAPPFEAFQRLHGPRPIEYKDWFYSKLHQFLSILVYEELSVSGVSPNRAAGRPQTDEPWKEGTGRLSGSGPIIQEDEVEQAVLCEDHEDLNWNQLVRELAGAGPDRFMILREWMETNKNRPGLSPKLKRGWTKNEERDLIICNCLRRGVSPGQICEELDRRTIATLEGLQRAGVFKWIDAWAHSEHRKRVQQLFSKLASRQKPVKSPPIAK